MAVTARAALFSALFSGLFSGPLQAPAAEPSMKEQCDMAEGRYERGLARLDRITRGAGQAVVDRLTRTSPDLARYVVEYPYGDVFCRSGLSDRQRQLATVAALAALGYARPELQVHIHGALNVGVTRQEIVETMILMSVYAGFPASIHGIRAAETVFAERDAAGTPDAHIPDTDTPDTGTPDTDPSDTGTRETGTPTPE